MRVVTVGPTDIHLTTLPSRSGQRILANHRDMVSGILITHWLLSGRLTISLQTGRPVTGFSQHNRKFIDVVFSFSSTSLMDLVHPLYALTILAGIPTTVTSPRTSARLLQQRQHFPISTGPITWAWADIARWMAFTNILTCTTESDTMVEKDTLLSNCRLWPDPPVVDKETPR